MSAHVNGLEGLGERYENLPEDLRNRVRWLADGREIREKSALFHAVHEQLTGQVLLNVVEFGKWDGNSDYYHAKRVPPAVSHPCHHEHPQRVVPWKWYPDYLDPDEDPAEFIFTVHCAIEGEYIDPKYLYNYRVDPKYVVRY